MSLQGHADLCASTRKNKQLHFHRTSRVCVMNSMFECYVCVCARVMLDRRETTCKCEALSQVFQTMLPHWARKKNEYDKRIVVKIPGRLTSSIQFRNIKSNMLFWLFLPIILYTAENVTKKVIFKSTICCVNLHTKQDVEAQKENLCKLTLTYTFYSHV